MRIESRALMLCVAVQDLEKVMDSLAEAIKQKDAMQIELSGALDRLSNSVPKSQFELLETHSVPKTQFELLEKENEQLKQQGNDGPTNSLAEAVKQKALQDQLDTLTKQLAAANEEKAELERYLESEQKERKKWEDKANAAGENPDADKLTAMLEKKLQQLETEKAEAEANVETEFTERRKWQDKAEELQKDLEKAQADVVKTDATGNTAELEKMLEQLKAEKTEAETNVDFEFTERRKWEDKAEELEKELATLKVVTNAQGGGAADAAAAGDDKVKELEQELVEKYKMLEQIKAEKAEAEANVETEFTERRKWQDKAEELQKDLDVVAVELKNTAEERDLSKVLLADLDKELNQAKLAAKPQCVSARSASLPISLLFSLTHTPTHSLSLVLVVMM